MKRTVRTIALLAAATLAGAAQAQEIKVGGIFDLTGLTADVGKPFAAGRPRRASRGRTRTAASTARRSSSSTRTTGTRSPRRVALYKRLVNDEKVVLIKAGAPATPRR